MKPNIPSGNRNTLPPQSYNADDHTPARPETLHIRDLFLFSCYTGIPYGDMCRLTTEDLEVAEDGEVWIKTARKKTKIDYEVPLLDIPLLILDKYRDMAPEGKLLPMYSNNELNRTLKRIAAICGIERKLVFHCLRHGEFSFLLKFKYLQFFAT